jgi:hypothetical protein
VQHQHTAPVAWVPSFPEVSAYTKVAYLWVAYIEAWRAANSDWGSIFASTLSNISEFFRSKFANGLNDGQTLSRDNVSIVASDYKVAVAIDPFLN